MSALMQEMMRDSPVGYWPMNDPVGSTTLKDVSGFAQHIAVPASGYTFQDTGLLPGEKNTRITGGAGFKITTPDARLRLTTGTVIVWVKGATASWGTTGGTTIFLLENMWNLLWKGSGVGVLGAGFGSWAYEGGGGALGDDTTKQIAMTFTSGGNTNIIVNGSTIATFATPAWGYTATMQLGDSVGRQTNIKYGHAAVYNTVLSTARLAQHRVVAYRGGVVTG